MALLNPSCHTCNPSTRPGPSTSSAGEGGRGEEEGGSFRQMCQPWPPAFPYPTSCLHSPGSPRNTAATPLDPPTPTPAQARVQGKHCPTTTSAPPQAPNSAPSCNHSHTAGHVPGTHRALRAVPVPLGGTPTVCWALVGIDLCQPIGASPHTHPCPGASVLWLTACGHLGAKSQGSYGVAGSSHTPGPSLGAPAPSQRRPDQAQLQPQLPSSLSYRVLRIC